MINNDDGFSNCILFNLILGKLFQRELFQYNRSRFQDKNNLNGGIEH